MFRIDWRKLFLCCAVLTVGSILVQIYSLPYPLKEWIAQPNPTISNNRILNTAVNVSEKRHSLAVGVDHRKLQSPTVLVSVNSSVNLNRSVISPKKETRVPRRRRRRNHAKTVVIEPSSPINKLPKHLEKYIFPLTPDEALAFAKRDIKNASLVEDDADPELYAPLFKNISTFRRSYEWMEWILKVYIYQEGDMPIFHLPHLTGIYSSEGWFMKSMEENKQFITKDPEKAHLFYLPYSARQLQMALYIPNSHNLRPLSIFLRDYVNMLAAKYPFWNRTHGSDHFLVACHDWVC